MSENKVPLPPVFFVLGGPGSGKGTNCEKLIRDFGFRHICAGDLLRAETKRGTKTGELIQSLMSSGNLVPSEITVGLLRDAIYADREAKGFLIDGFPRKMDQALMFEEGIAVARGIIYFDCKMETMEERLLSRNAGRVDDNIDAIRQRFRVNEEQSMPVVEKYTSMGRCERIDSNRDPDAVYSDVKRVFIEKYGCEPLA